MRGLILLLLLLIGWYAMLRQKLDNKKYPNTYDAHKERSDRLFTQVKKMEKRYGENSDQKKAAYKEYLAEKIAWEEYKKNEEK